MQRCTFHARHELHNPCIAHVLDQPVDDVVAKIAMSHLPALEAQRRLDLVAFRQEPDCLVLLRLIVMLIHSYRELDFLHDDDLLLLPRSPIALVLLVQKFSVILNTAYRRHGIRGNFHQIQPAFASDLQGLKWLQDA